MTWYRYNYDTMKNLKIDYSWNLCKNLINYFQLGLRSVDTSNWKWKMINFRIFHYLLLLISQPDNSLETFLFINKVYVFPVYLDFSVLFATPSINYNVCSPHDKIFPKLSWRFQIINPCAVLIVCTFSLHQKEISDRPLSLSGITLFY